MRRRSRSETEEPGLERHLRLRGTGGPRAPGRHAGGHRLPRRPHGRQPRAGDGPRLPMVGRPGRPVAEHPPRWPPPHGLRRDVRPARAVARRRAPGAARSPRAGPGGPGWRLRRHLVGRASSMPSPPPRPLRGPLAVLRRARRRPLLRQRAEAAPGHPGTASRGGPGGPAPVPELLLRARRRVPGARHPAPPPRHPPDLGGWSARQHALFHAEGADRPEVSRPQDRRPLVSSPLPASDRPPPDRRGRGRAVPLGRPRLLRRGRLAPAGRREGEGLQPRLRSNTTSRGSRPSGWPGGSRSP